MVPSSVDQRAQRTVDRLVLRKVYWSVVRRDRQMVDQRAGMRVAMMAAGTVHSMVQMLAEWRVCLKVAQKVVLMELPKGHCSAVLKVDHWVHWTEPVLAGQMDPTMVGQRGSLTVVKWVSWRAVQWVEHLDHKMVVQKVDLKVLPWDSKLRQFHKCIYGSSRNLYRTKSRESHSLHNLRRQRSQAN